MSSKIPQSYSFTLKADSGRFREIVSEIGISVPFVESGSVQKDDKRILHTSALWDTGATNSVVTKSTAQNLSLKPISKSWSYHAGGKSLVNVYLVNIYLPNNIVIPNVRVSECDDSAGNFGVIIGMDIITHGDFSITNVNNETTFSFRIPSLKTIDYEVEQKTLAKKVNVKVGRNDPCPCKSGKKFKHCHGKK